MLELPCCDTASLAGITLPLERLSATRTNYHLSWKAICDNALILRTKINIYCDKFINADTPLVVINNQVDSLE